MKRKPSDEELQHNDSGSQRQVGHSILTPRQPSWVTPGHQQSAEEEEVLVTLSRLSVS